MTGHKLFASPSIPVALKKCGSAHRAAGSREAPGRASWSMSVMAIFHQRSIGTPKLDLESLSEKFKKHIADERGCHGDCKVGSSKNI